MWEFLSFIRGLHVLTFSVFGYVCYIEILEAFTGTDRRRTVCAKQRLCRVISMTLCFQSVSFNNGLCSRFERVFQSYYNFPNNPVNKTKKTQWANQHLVFNTAFMFLILTSSFIWDFSVINNMWNLFTSDISWSWHQLALESTITHTASVTYSACCMISGPDNIPLSPLSFQCENTTSTHNHI